MATQQQAMIMDTIVALRKAVKRKAYESDSDSSIEHNTNRGNKLKKRARFVRQGQLSAQATGHTTHKEVAEHAGYQRSILRPNPPLIDDDGYEVDSDDNDERMQEAIARRDQENPYASIHIEQLLAPLTAVTDLPTHPTMSRPFKSKALTELASQGCDLMHKENAALWKVKPLLTKLHGDSTWTPCGIFTEPDDHELFTDTMRFLSRPIQPTALNSTATLMITNGTSHQSHTGAGASKDAARDGSDSQDQDKNADVDMGEPNGHQTGGSGQDKGKGKEVVNGEKPAVPPEETGPNGKKSAMVGEEAEGQTNGEKPPEETNKENGEDSKGVNSAEKTTADEDVEMADAQILGEAQASSSKKSHPDPHPSKGGGELVSLDELNDDMLIHPLFLAPRSAHPDRNLGLPEQEAEDVRRLVQLYVQKQEEICRGAKKLFEGLLKADRYRKTVFRWAKAEAHCGPNRDLSDGEDWIDKEEWGLTEDLKKGQDEEEEDQTTQQKKTRNRK